MPRYYCDYCDTYLTHDSPSVRKQHNAGYKHKANVRQYYQQYEAQLNQSFIDQKVKEHLGVYRPVAPVGAAYNPMRPGVAILPTPQMPYPGGMTLPPGAPLIPGIRPPMMMHRPPPGAPAYMSGPPMSMMVAPPSAPQLGQSTDIQRPTTAPPMGMPPSSGAASLFTPVYQGAVPTSTSTETSNSIAQATEAAH